MKSCTNEIYLAGGCFWGTEKYLDSLCGVQKTEVGYCNGNKPDVTYEEVCRGSGHAEAVRVVFDADILPLAQLLEDFYLSIDPTSFGRQGMDIGPQYRTGIYYSDEKQLDIINQSLASLQKQYNQPIAVEAMPLEHFCRAEEHHQKYLDKNPGGYCHINFNKIEKAKNRIVDQSNYQKPELSALKQSLTELQFAVTQQNHTEPPFNNQFWDNEKIGLYVDITTGEPLFTSKNKFDSGCGWPSFTKPLDPNTITEYDDISHDMIRTEVRSRVGNAHLGHVFTDGPKNDGGLRYCINSASLKFIPKEEMQDLGYGDYLKYLN